MWRVVSSDVVRGAHLQGAFLVPSERCSIEKQSIKYCGCGVLCLVTWCAERITSLDTTRHNIHNILSTAPQLSMSHKALETLPEDGNVMPKHVGAAIHN